ncbi:MAG TPA: ATP-binding protein [Longimicrobium sp.]|nr:ATP-binding protein [Longimicrobium sp.]
MNEPGSVHIEPAERRLELLEARVHVLSADARAEADALLEELRATVAGLRRLAGSPHALLEEQAARRHAEAARQREAFLAQAGEILAGSLDYETTLASVARLCVPRVADSCIVYLMGEGGEVQRLGAAHADPRKEELLRAVLASRPFDPHAVSAPIARALRTGEAELLPEIDDEGPEGEVAPRSLLVVPLRIRERILGALSLGWDEPGRYTPDALWLARKLADRAALAVENARLHREAQRASEVKSEFLAAMSHELRTPINATLGYTELMEMGVAGALTAQQREYLERIRRTQQHLLGIITDLLNYSRIEAGQVEYDITPVPACEIIDAVLPMVEPQALARGLELLRGPCEDGLVARADRAKAQQIVLNLLGNAVKFTPAGGSVTVSCGAEAARIVITVADTGEGIEPDQHSAIFEPFVQLGRSLTSGHEGTGLGLAISRDLARAMGGDLTVRSTPGEGAEFTLALESA